MCCWPCDFSSCLIEIWLFLWFWLQLLRSKQLIGLMFIAVLNVSENLVLEKLIQLPQLMFEQCLLSMSHIVSWHSAWYCCSALVEVETLETCGCFQVSAYAHVQNLVPKYVPSFSFLQVAAPFIFLRAIQDPSCACDPRVCYGMPFSGLSLDYWNKISCDLQHFSSAHTRGEFQITGC